MSLFHEDFIATVLPPGISRAPGQSPDALQIGVASERLSVVTSAVPRGLGQAKYVEHPARPMVVRVSFRHRDTAVRHDRTAPVCRAAGVERGEQLPCRGRVAVQPPVVDVEQAAGDARARTALAAVPGKMQPAAAEDVAVEA